MYTSIAMPMLKHPQHGISQQPQTNKSVDAVFLIDMVEKQNGWTKERVAMDMWGGVELMSHARLHPQKRTIITR